MNIIAIIKTYLTLNVLIALTSIVVFFCAWLGRYFSIKMSFGQILRLSYVLVALSLVLPIMATGAPKTNIWSPKAQVWTAFKANNVLPSAEGENPNLSISLGSVKTPLASDTLTYGLLGLIALGWILVGGRVLRDSRILVRIIRESFTVKKYGAVSILAYADSIVPFSVWLPFKSYVVVPQGLLTEHGKYALIVKHELQHHRQQDTKWIYVLQFLGALCFWNPFVYLLQKQIGDLQEVACDEALIGHQGVSSKAYCDCLLWAAQKSLQSHSQLVGTAGFARGSAAKLLKRRIEEMLTTRTTYLSRMVAVSVGILATGVLTAATAATNSSIQDRRIDKAAAQKMAEFASSPEFPVVLNDLVLDQLNKFLGTPDGRERIRNGLTRMKDYEDELGTILKGYHLPQELLAVPLIESGYRNIPQSQSLGKSAGLWMFMPQTARNFGLRVDARVDERLDVPRATDAAARLLGSLNLQFKDWGLALMGYNSGNGAVERAIQETGSRDVWELIRKGYENDAHYVASVMAAVIIIKNPSYLD